MINAIMKDDYCLDFVLEKMRGKLRQLEGTKEEDEIEMYRNSQHTNYFIPSGDGFLCVQDCGEYVIIPFAWHKGGHDTLKEMVRLGKELYINYSIHLNKPIYYTGLKNLYGHNSEEVAENVWLFKPKHLPESYGIMGD